MRISVRPHSRNGAQRERWRAAALLVVAALVLTTEPVTTAGADAPASRWQSAIDDTWGPGVPTERKLEIFDTFWTTIDERYSSFQGLDVDWAALRDRYRPEIAAGVSRGRFAAIMGHLALALLDGHTFAFDLPVLQTPRLPGVPIMVLRGAPFNTFGACATARDDGSALIYDVAPRHPLGLERGDRILGYDGRPWRELIRELLAAELPWAGNSWGSSPSAFEHTLVQSAGVNWHLFDTIDIRKHSTGSVEHYSTGLLNTTPALRSPFCTEQLPVPGVGKPAALTHTVSWGIVEGTRIGYVYVSVWGGDAGERFEEAIREITQARETDGLIIDFRFVRGGNMFLSDAALGMLFDRPVPTIGFAERADPDDHLKMRPIVGETSALCPGLPGFPPIHYVIDMCDGIYDPRSYERPIAVLTGPGAISSGDQVALRMTYHPRARVFGKTTNTAFNSPEVCPLNLSEPGWSIAYACADSYRISAPHDYLTHDDLPVDQPVWLRPDDIANGKDTVVDAAVHWITSQTP